MVKIFDCNLGKMTRGEFEAILYRMAAPCEPQLLMVQAHLEFYGMKVIQRKSGQNRADDTFIFEGDDKNDRNINEDS